MKKPSYSVTINYIKDHNVESISLTGEAAEAVNAQAHMGQDLRFHYESEQGDNVVIPWEAVVGVQIYKTMEDVTAPTDAICGGAATPTLEVTFNEEHLGTSFESEEEPCNVGIWPIAFIETITLDGEDVTDAWMNAYNTNPQSAADVIGGTYDADLGGWLVTVPCDAESLKATIVYKYGDASETYTVALEVDNGGLD